MIIPPWPRYYLRSNPQIFVLLIIHSHCHPRLRTPAVHLPGVNHIMGL